MLSTRSGDYKKPEGGLGPDEVDTAGEMDADKKLSWKKIAIGAAVIIGLVWFFETQQRLPWPGYGGSEAVKIEQYTSTNSVQAPADPSPIHTSVEAETEYALPHPSSFEEDKDPSGTTYCSSPFSSSAHLVQYAVMIDAGSTGSRIHIYKFNNCRSVPSYEYEVFKQTRPSLYSYYGRSEEAAASLDVLLNEAVRVIPESLHSYTPVAVKASGGLRMLPGSQSQDVLDAIEARLKSHYPFRLYEPDGVVIMDGKEAMVYAWVMANYLLNTIRVDTHPDTHTYAVLDLGGASAQIVFEPDLSKSDSFLELGEHKYDLDLRGEKRILYQHSFLGYGLIRARKRVHELVGLMHSDGAMSSDQIEEGETVVSNPCLAKGTKRLVQIENVKTDQRKWVMMGGEQIGGFEACTQVIKRVISKDSDCEAGPCSFDGVYQPPLLDTFPTGKVLLLSYFYDRINPLLTPGTDGNLTVSTIAALARDVCQGEETWSNLWGANIELMQELRARPEWCLDLTFMYGLLRFGYGFEDTRDVVIERQIDGVDLGWYLGAAIAMVDGV